jgi:hypothetical protein
MLKRISTPTTIAVISGADKIADWMVRKSGSGVTYAENWSSYASAAAAMQAPASMNMNYTSNGAPGPGFDNVFQIVTDPAHVLSGKALRVFMGANGYPQTSGDLSNGYWYVLANGDKNNQAAATHRHLFVQMIVWVDSYVDYYWLDGNGQVVGPKVFRVDHTSTDVGEFVVTNQNSMGFVAAYYRTPNNNEPIERGQYTPLHGPTNVAYQPAVDNGTPLDDTEASYWRRYGAMHYEMPFASSQASPLHTQAPPTPNPDAAGANGGGGVAWNRGGFTVVEVEVDLDQGIGRWWGAKYGDPPKLLGQIGPGADFGARADGFGGFGWSAVCLDPLVYSYSAGNPSANQAAHNPGYPLAWVDYAEIIFSTAPIVFPLQLNTPLP